ncbi:uncharacterized protein EV422DRAFT_597966 [Fimicolochytrium jonesii]|uniref:uncharacterized protein n=1 Tax=Fimicolochytrium jonesii TaxID=1396493 RepID=UPI0022FDD5B8|nr:uncharacterized protein EV422DRAFT_597966 [Fimicolochytrium jonesii]KAI8820028.1 hypothetical protein EV422DRAFT_597966 [Fimicolochytrium jonesii]
MGVPLYKYTAVLSLPTRDVQAVFTANTLQGLSQQLGLCPDTIHRLVVKGDNTGYKKLVPFSIKREALPKAIMTSKPANMNGWKVPPMGGGPTPVTQTPIAGVWTSKVNEDTRSVIVMAKKGGLFREREGERKGQGFSACRTTEDARSVQGMQDGLTPCRSGGQAKEELPPFAHDTLEVLNQCFTQLRAMDGSQKKINVAFGRVLAGYASPTSSIGCAAQDRNGRKPMLNSVHRRLEEGFSYILPTASRLQWVPFYTTCCTQCQRSFGTNGAGYKTHIGALQSEPLPEWPFEAWTSPYGARAIRP